MEVHQVLVAARHGDAITKEAVRLREELRRHGPSEIYSYHRVSNLPGILPLDEFEAETPGCRILAHSSIGERPVHDFLTSRTEPVILRYHNITPPQFFERYDPEFAKLLSRGREELTRLRPRVKKAIAVSAFNALDLKEAGYEKTAVVPLVVDLDELRSAGPPRERFWLPPREEGPVIVFVGRIAPNKGQHRLLQAFHVLKTYHRPDSHLFLVGGKGISGYSDAVHQYQRELGLADVTFTGGISDEELAAVYRRADVLVCLSEHEGFCAPLVEAMAFGVPVVALDSAAVADTLGGAGLLLDSAAPDLVAEAIREVLEDRPLRDELLRRGTERVQEFEPDLVARNLAAEVIAA
jgi:glycosyltransferase involved in cell wall biosynthesis